MQAGGSMSCARNVACYWMELSNDQSVGCAQRSSEGAEPHRRSLANGMDCTQTSRVQPACSRSHCPQPIVTSASCQSVRVLPTG